MSKFFARAAAGMTVSMESSAQINELFAAPVSAPTPSEIGIGVLVVLVGVVAGIVMRRRK